MVPPSAYTVDKLKAARVWGEGSLPLAKLTIGAEKGSSTMLVLVRRGTQEVLLGQDFPYFADLMHASLPSFVPTTGLFGPTLDKIPEEGLHEWSKPTSQEETTDCPTSKLTEDRECLAEKLDMECDDMAVQTRAQRSHPDCNWTTVYSLVEECDADCPNTRSVSRHRRGPKGGGTPVKTLV
jgi:hypothetical protein